MPSTVSAPRIGSARPKAPEMRGTIFIAPSAGRGRRPRSVVAVALANKIARIVWAMLSRDQNYRSEAIAPAA